MACKQLENIWELTPMRFFTAVRQRFWNIWNKIIVPSTSFTPEGTSVFLGWAKKMLSIPTPASGHSFFCLTALVVKKKVNKRSQVRNFSHQWSSQMKSRFLLRKGKQKNTAGGIPCNMSPCPIHAPSRSDVSCWKVGYLPDGTPMNRAGNCINHPETIGPDPHAPGIVFGWFSWTSKFGNPKNS